MLSKVWVFAASDGWTWMPDFTQLIPIGLVIGVLFAIILVCRIAIRAWSLTWLEFSGWVAFYSGFPLTALCLFVFEIPEPARHGFALESLLASILGLLMVIIARLRK